MNITYIFELNSEDAKALNNNDKAFEQMNYSLLKGTLLGNRYKLEEFVQNKRNTVIFKGTCLLLQRPVLVEIMKQKCSNDSADFRIFRAAAENVSRLNHKNILSVYDVGIDNGTAYVVKEHIDFQPLDIYIKNKVKFHISEAIEISKELVDGLEYASNNKVIHADLSPENILIDYNGSVKINYNYVSALAEDKENYQFISPEVIENNNITFRSDIYSLGCVLFYMFAGKMLFDNEDFYSVTRSHLQTKPPIAKAINKVVPVGISDMIQKCLNKAPHDRFASYDDVRSVLKREKVYNDIIRDNTLNYIREKNIVPIDEELKKRLTFVAKSINENYENVEGQFQELERFLRKCKLVGVRYHDGSYDSKLIKMSLQSINTYLKSALEIADDKMSHPEVDNYYDILSAFAKIVYGRN